MKQTVSEQALALVEKKIDDLKGSLTPQDAAAATGVTVSEARDALTRLMELYITRVSYDEQGNVLFAFEMPLRRRGTKTAAEKWAETKETLWKGFKVFYKILIGVVVIGYFLVMVVLLLAIMIAMSSRRDDDDDSPAGNAIGGLFRVMAEGLRFAFWTHALSPGPYAMDDHGYRYRTTRVPSGVREKKKSFVIAIYDLALGPERASSDPLENEQEVAAYLREEKGVLTTAELVGLSGVPIVDAEERMADYLVRFNGEPTITEEGVVVGEFESYLSGRTQEAGGRIVPYWEEYEAPYEHSGNSTGRNVAIIAMVLFTLVVGLGLLGGGLETLAVYGPFFESGAARFLLGWFPIAFSLSYLLISLLRLPGVKKREKERLERNREKRVMRAIFQNRLWRTTAEQVHFAMMSLGEKEMQGGEVEAIIQRLLPKLQGDIELDAEGKPTYVFGRLQREIEAAERLRKG